ncbi:hypothetical protein ACLK1V_21980 [Escherichia coli]
MDTCLTTTAKASIVFGFAHLLFYGLCTAARSAGRVATGNYPGKPYWIWLSAARSTPKPKATANISFIYRAVISSSLKRRVLVEW